MKNKEKTVSNPNLNTFGALIDKVKLLFASIKKDEESMSLSSLDTKIFEKLNAQGEQKLVKDIEKNIPKSVKKNKGLFAFPLWFKFSFASLTVAILVLFGVGLYSGTIQGLLFPVKNLGMTLSELKNEPKTPTVVLEPAHFTASGSAAPDNKFT